MGGFLASAPANADTVRISNLSNITVPLWVTGDTSIIQDVFVCVYRANTTGNSTSYGITATGDGPGFLLKSGTNNVAYTVTWNDGGASNPGGGTTATMINNVKLTSRSNARNNKVTPINSSDCNAGASPTARLRITLSQTAMDAARDGVFTGVLTLVLSPT
jgi:hypothetical protein